MRSSPDQYKWNNYGPSTNSNQLMNPRQRDWDKDGTPNYLDRNDDNDQFQDDYDNNQYSTPQNDLFKDDSNSNLDLWE